ncbi:1-acyl-sn-glycerol-3-phosphate acyltransferase [Alkaliphilus metalliredigens QYMF]|uniref:1-acyl-sn-glycerol-3-phosphate acyltransferase n=1 Tax=Alkaliphilus metalliredigens (strain QYMF) TaxID=293826 RepID=A6TRG0_ALKMQ|nr:lysophospholipid acyltransferase family protein [Alkaliphilus metalliredigens]ABR48778.1 1-acyl-sn-glycerol-3-phosphate acyltransferase [Alkaliphilus metalliredigens QYMF]
MLFYRIIKRVVNILLRLLYKLELTHVEKIPTTGKAIICSNHFNLWDPLVIGTSLPRKVHYMAKEELFSNPLMSLIIKNLGVFPVKRGTSDIGAIKTALKILKEGNSLGMFPEGTRSKTGKMKEAMPGIAMIAIKSRSPVIPIAIISNYKLFNELKVIVGDPMDLSDYYDEKLTTDEYQQISQNILDTIQELMN